MTTLGFNAPLYILPFDHRGSFQTKMFGWSGALSPNQAAEIAAIKQVIYDGFKAAVDAGVSRGKAGILVDEQFGARFFAMRRNTPIQLPARPRRAARRSSISSTVKTLPNTSSPSIQPSVKSWFAITLRAIAL